jgi:LuxR family maltose regulon positive regulatory protein
VSVVAPPGYGKTVLLADWTARAGEPVAWLTVDALDNDPSVFLSYLAVAIDRIEPIDGAVAAAIATPRSRVLATAVPHLAQALHAIGRPALVVLDDVHRLVDRTCLDALAQLLDYLPPGLRVAIAARAEPDLPFGRLRARGDLIEITGRDLALDAEETEAIAGAAGWRLAPSEARALAKRTEGWAAGIYLAAVAGRREGPGRAPVDVSGRSGYIAEYLRSEFQADLQDEDLAFLTQTSILEVVEAPLADAVVGSHGAAGRLAALAHSNQLIEVVSGPDTAYRYHGLLREFLLSELERREPGMTPTLHRRAAAWCADADRTELAIEHGLVSDDPDTAARLVTAATLSTLYGGHGDTLDRWLGSWDPHDPTGRHGRAARRSHRRARRVIHAHARRAATAADPLHAHAVRGDRRAPGTLEAHDQDPGTFDLREAGGVESKRGDRAGGRDRPARAVPRSGAGRETAASLIIAARPSG